MLFLEYSNILNIQESMFIEVDCVPPERLDVYLSKKMPELSRSKIQALIKNKHISLNEGVTKAKAQVSSGDIISVEIPEVTEQETLAEDIPVQILFEDDHIIVLNKESGMVVHPAAGNKGGTLVNALLHHCNGKLAPIGGDERPGIVHRLDKDTSGCIIVAKTDQAHQHLVEQFASRTTHKEYIAVVDGHPVTQKETINTNIGRHPVNRLKMAVVDSDTGKTAITDYKVCWHEESTTSTLMHCIIHTGRTHQIRVHMKHIGCPIIGDVIYSNVNRQSAKTGRLMLHARILSITHPDSGEKLTFKSPIPEVFKKWTSRSEELIFSDI